MNRFQPLWITLPMLGVVVIAFVAAVPANVVYYQWLSEHHGVTAQIHTMAKTPQGTSTQAVKQG